MYFKIIIILCLFVTIHADTTFIHLFGYSLLADTSSTIDAVDVLDCLEECVETNGCVGIQMLWGTGKCKLLTMVRAAVVENSDCTFYIRNYANFSISGRTLSDIDQVVQNAVYASQSECPDGWTNHTNGCTLGVTETICNEYASFFGTSWDGTECIIPNTTTYVCPNSSYTLGSFSDGSYCHMVISKWSTNPNSLTVYDRSNEYCFEQTGGYLSSIHSAQENALILSLVPSSPAAKGIIIGLVPASNTMTTIYDVKWLDGTLLTYTNYVYTPIDTVGAQTFTNSAMTPGGMWNTFPVSTKAGNYISCKKSATAVFT